MTGEVRVACCQVEPVVLDRERTLDKLAATAAVAARDGARLVVFPETFVPAYPSSAGHHHRLDVLRLDVAVP